MGRDLLASGAFQGWRATSGRVVSLSWVRDLLARGAFQGWRATSGRAQRRLSPEKSTKGGSSHLRLLFGRISDSLTTRAVGRRPADGSGNRPYRAPLALFADMYALPLPDSGRTAR